MNWQQLLSHKRFGKEDAHKALSERRTEFQRVTVLIICLRVGGFAQWKNNSLFPGQEKKLDVEM